MVNLANSALFWALERVRLNGKPVTLYPYQSALLADRSPRRLVLKARQTGISTAAAIELAHEAIFRPRSLSLVISRDQSAAANVLTLVFDIMDALDAPPALVKRNAYEAVLANGSRIVSQPATAKAGRGLTSSRVVLDEAAFMEYDSRIYKAVSPTLSRGGNLTVISTPNGQANLFARLWMGSEGGEWSCHLVHWRQCPAFDDAWFARERPKYTAADWGSEYECDFPASGEAVFNPDDVEAMRTDWAGLQGPQPGHRYVTGWDIGRRRDATVGVTVDATKLPHQVVAFQRLLTAPYAQTMAAIDARADTFGGKVLVESNSIGDPVIEGLTAHVKPFTTTAKSKADALTRLVRAVEQGELKCGVEQVLSELKSYQWDDSGIVQDSVIALAIAMTGAAHTFEIASGASEKGMGIERPADLWGRKEGPLFGRRLGLWEETALPYLGAAEER